MGASKRHWIKALVLSGVLAGAVWSSFAAARKERPVRYAGSVASQTRSEVDIKVRKKVKPGPDRNKWILFEAIFVQSCEDGSKDLTGGSAKLRFNTARRFRGTNTEVDDESNVQEFRLQGKILGDGKARGRLWNRLDRRDPPSPGFPDLPDCATDGWLSWHADRTGS
jgi:hypothetical protein